MTQTICRQVISDESMDLALALVDEDIDKDITAMAQKIMQSLRHPPSACPAKRRRSLEAGHAFVISPSSASPPKEEELPVVKRPSIVRRCSVGLLDAVTSADTTLAKLEAFLSGDDSHAHLFKGGGDLSKSSLQSELCHLRDSEDVVRRELEGLGMISGSSGTSDGSLSLRSWRMASTSSAFEEHWSRQDNDTKILDDEIAAKGARLSVVRGESSSSSLGVPVLDEKSTSRHHLAMAFGHSSDMSLDLQDLFGNNNKANNNGNDETDNDDNSSVTTDLSFESSAVSSDQSVLLQDEALECPFSNEEEDICAAVVKTVALGHEKRRNGLLGLLHHVYSILFIGPNICKKTETEVPDRKALDSCQQTNRCRRSFSRGFRIGLLEI